MNTFGSGFAVGIIATVALEILFVLAYAMEPFIASDEKEVHAESGQ